MDKAAIKKTDSSKYIDICNCGQEKKHNNEKLQELPTANCSANKSNAQTVQDSQQTEGKNHEITVIWLKIITAQPNKKRFSFVFHLERLSTNEIYDDGENMWA